MQPLFNRICFLFLVCTGFNCTLSIGQGCSDAGFCSAGVLKSGSPATDTAANRWQYGVAFTLGSGEQGTTIGIFQAEIGRKLGAHGVIDFTIPVVTASGDLGNHTGIGDPLITYSYLNHFNSTWTFGWVAGSRISTGSANARFNSRPLPMPYQSNLGTTDLIAGLSATYHSWLSFDVGYQQPVLQYNKNEYLTTSYAEPVDSIYFSSNMLKRKGDLLLRIEGSTRFHKLRLTAGPLLIYHLAKDQISVASNRDVSLRGSNGLTLNISGTASYPLGKFLVSLQLAAPYIVREYRPDGLTRAWVITLRLSKM